MDKITQMNFITLEEIDDLRKNIGFHFTPTQNLESILKTGLLPRIGANASGAIGQSVIPKTYISYGLEGVMQLYNRILNVSLEIPIEYFRGSSSHKTFLPSSAQTKDGKSRLSILEGFEWVRQYMENNTYLIFDASMGEYEHPLDDSDINDINEYIHNLEDENGNNIYSKVREINKKIAELTNDTTMNHREEINRYVKERETLVVDIWRQTSEIVRNKQGKLINGNEELIMDRIDFDDENLRWVNFGERPYNIHTKIVENKNGDLKGLPILPQNLRVFSMDGKKHENGIEFMKKMHLFISEEDKVAINYNNRIDVNLLNYFYEYVKLIEQYRAEQEISELSSGRTAGFTVDFSDISKYPGLKEFAEEVSQYYRSEREEATAIERKAWEEAKAAETKKRKETETANKGVIRMEDVVRNAVNQGVATEDIEQAQEVERPRDKKTNEVSKDE